MCPLIRYLKSSREIKRIEAVTRSPIYSDFSAVLEGLSTLRAFGLQKRITQSFCARIDDNARAWFSFLMVSRYSCLGDLSYDELNTYLYSIFVEQNVLLMSSHLLHLLVTYFKPLTTPISYLLQATNCTY